jgi:hypothetical protein
MRRPPSRSRPPRDIVRKPQGSGYHWSRDDEALLRAGTWRYAEPHEPTPACTPSPRGEPPRFGGVCMQCSITILAERRRMTVPELLNTIERRFGGTLPNGTVWSQKEGKPVFNNRAEEGERE